MIPNAPTVSLAAAVLTAGLTSVGAPAALQAQGATTEIVFASGPDDSGTLRRSLERFNAAHQGDIRVVWRPMAQENDAHRRELREALASDPGGIDLIAADVVWTAELTDDGWAADLTDRFYDAYDRDAFLPAPLSSATYDLRIRGVPWYTDAGLLYYRRDLLEASGFTAPPTTWEELSAVARRVMDDAGMPFGFVFQGAAYEGGAVNASEFVWSAGGEVMERRIAVTGLVVNTVTEIDSVKVGSDAAARGFDIARGLVADGVAPADVSGFREGDALEAFLAGEAVFMRNWPYAFRILRDAGFTEEQVGLASLPAASPGRHASCLGGWNLMVNANSSEAERDAAWTLIRYLTDEEQQRAQALGAGLLPVRPDLYDDAALIDALPALTVGRRVFESQLHTRPKTPFYDEVSASIARTFTRVLDGDITGREAAALLERELRTIVVRNR